MFITLTGIKSQRKYNLAIDNISCFFLNKECEFTIVVTKHGKIRVLEVEESMKDIEKLIKKNRE